MALADQKIANLTKDVKKLKDQNLELTEKNEMLLCHCNNRDKEIARLMQLLEGGRSLDAVRKDCSCSRNKFHLDKSESDRLRQEKSVLEQRLKGKLIMNLYYVNIRKFILYYPLLEGLTT